MIFVFDLDDTICKTDEYSEFYIQNFFAKHNLPYKQITKVVRFAEKKFDWDRETANKWYKKYGDQMMLEFPCKENAVKTINALFDQGHKIIIATARADDWHTNPEEITHQWIKKVGLKVSKVYVGRVDKERICEYENADIFVDDDINITSKVSEYFQGKPGKHAFLMNSDYNQTQETPKNVTRVFDFSSLLKEVEKMDRKK